MAGYIGSTPVPLGIQEQQSFSASAGQTTFNTLGYSDGNTIKVTLNGSLLEGGGVDYTATNGSDIVLTTAASVDDVLTFETLNEFNLVNQNLTTPTFTDSASVTSTTTANVSVSGDTTATVTLKNNTEEDTNGGRESTLIFQGEQSGGEISTLAEIEASHDSSADDEKGSLVFRTNDGSDGTSPTEVLRLKNDGNLLLGTTVAGRAAEGADRLTIADAAHSGLTIRSGSTSYGSINFSDSEGGAGEYAGSIFFGHGASLGDRLTFATAGSNRVSIDSDGLKFNNDTAAANALDDYEEGAWTPSFSFSSGSVGYSYQSGQYTKIGRKVSLTANLIVNSVSSPSGACRVVTLPFNSGTDSNTTTNEGYVTGVTVSIVRNLGSVLTLRAYIPANSNYINLTKNATNQGHVSFDASDLTSSSLIYLSATYNTAS